MDAVAMEVARLVLRQDAAAESESTPVCAGSNDYDGRMGVRISSIFVIFVGSLWGKSISSPEYYIKGLVSVYHCHWLWYIVTLPLQQSHCYMSHDLTIHIY